MANRKPLANNSGTVQEIGSPDLVDSVVVPRLGFYGDGSDGTVAFDGVATVLGLAPSGSVYNLARDLFLAAATVSSGVTLITNGFRIYCAGTFTNNGTVQWDGSPGNNNSGGNTTTNANSPLAQTTNAGAGGGAGGTAAGTAGGAQTQGCLGGVGGTGGTGTSGAGAAGGAATVPTTVMGLPRVLPMAAVGMLMNGTAWTAIRGGTGGGGGGGDTTNAGGGGGGGGGIVVVAARTISGVGAVHARGGNGATRSVGNVGGGGGGGGGVVIVVSGSVSGGAVTGQTIDANGGAKGSPHGTGTDNATAGAVGTVVLLSH